MPAHSHKNHLKTERGVSRAEDKAILLFSLLLIAVVIIWGFFEVAETHNEFLKLNGILP
jgi:hypothetical protein